jgi:hypothetical protein
MIDIPNNITGGNVRMHFGPVGTNRGLFVSAKEPQNEKEWVTLLKRIVVMLEASDVEDKEVLGKYSPKNQ